MAGAGAVGAPLAAPEGAARSPVAMPAGGFEADPAAEVVARVGAEVVAGDYLSRRGALIEDLAAARAAESRVGLLLDLATLSAAHALAPEARSFLAGLPERLTPEARGRRDRIALAAWGVDGGTMPAPRRARDLATEGDWNEAPAWRALIHAREGEIAAAKAVLPEAGAALDAMPPALRAAILPELLEAAIEAALWDTAHGLAQRFDAHPELRGGAAYRFLLGRAAQAGGNPLMAFDSYAMATGGSDVWAQRARLALVDLGRATDTLAPEDAAALLRQSWRLWRGDALEIATLERLAEVEYGRGAVLDAIDALSEIQRRHPGSDAAAGSDARLDRMLAEFYDRGGTGALPIAEFVAAHRRLAPELMFRPNFAALAERLAARLRDIGATDAAAREYGAIHDQLAVMRELGLEAVTPARLQALRLSQAEALLNGGQIEAAAEAFAALRGTAPDLRDRAMLLRARLSQARGDGAGVVATRMQAPSKDYLRLRAGALFAQGDWSAARDAYAALWRDLGAALEPGDALRLLLAAHRAGDTALVAALTERLPELARRPEIAEIARSLAPVAPLILPIGRETATRRLQDADAALRRLESVAGDG